MFRPEPILFAFIVSSNLKETEKNIFFHHQKTIKGITVEVQKKAFMRKKERERARERERKKNRDFKIQI